MTITDELSEYITCKGKFLYTILVHNHSNEELVDIVKKKLENINKKINNSFKKKAINDKIYSFITYLESSMKKSDIVNAIFLIDDKVNKLDMSKSEKSFCQQWGISKFIFEFDEEFKINFLQELLTTKFIKSVFKFDKSNYSVIELDSTKSRKVESHTSLDEDSITKMIAVHNPVAMYGLNQSLKKLTHLENKKMVVVNKNLSNEEILDIIQTKNIENNQELFKIEFLDNIHNPSEMDKLVFGHKEISEAIEGYLIKKIFVNPRIHNLIKEKFDSSLLNFEVIIVQSLTSGDYGQQLNKNYGGIVGIKYY